MFVDGVSGTLMEIRKSNKTRLEFTAWFPFTRSRMQTVREGALLAARNFSSVDGRMDHYSIMRITSVLPTHYALGTGLKGYPGFVEEAALNASKDWSQEKPTEDTTKIVCEAVPTTFEIMRPTPLVNEPGEEQIVLESNMPMVGERVSMVNPEWTERIINLDLQRLRDRTIPLGKLANSGDVDVLVLWDDLIRTHFGVFAYTNAGKSNLMSTLIAKVFERADCVKIVIYDLMGEYGALLIDVLHSNPDALIVYLSSDAAPDTLLKYWEDQAEDSLVSAARDIVDTTVLPKALKELQSKLYRPVQDILRKGRIKTIVPDERLNRVVQGVVDGANRSSVALTKFVDHLNIPSLNHPADVSNVGSLIGQVDRYDVSGPSVATVKEVRSKLLDVLGKKRDELATAEKIDPRFKIGTADVISSLNDESGSSLYVLQGGDDEQVRLLSSELGSRMLVARRKAGRIAPLVSFIYDEADQFISQEDGLPGMKESKRAAHDLARRGRKYGLGIGIATQRIVYLDTSVLGQPHTYLVSKLPRESDRKTIQEAFGLSDETLGESLRFRPGQWLLISHGATGIDGLPIPIQLPDANKRIGEFLDGLEGS